MRLVLSLSYALLFAATALAQLEVKAGVRQRIDNVSGLTQVGDTLYLETDQQLTTKTVGVFRVITEAANVQVDVSDQARTPFEAVKRSPDTYEIDKPGKWWIDVTAIDFAKNLYSKKSIVLEFGSGPPPPPPGPGPGPTPPTPPSPVVDTYGVGVIAYQFAPRSDAVNIAKYASLYRQAGDFLFGVPSLKFIVSDNPSHNNDPNRSVMAWLSQEFGRLQCTDQATCQQWATWRQKVSDAMRASQTKRQYTRDDWYNAFHEIAAAMGAIR